MENLCSVFDKYAVPYEILSIKSPWDIEHVRDELMRCLDGIDTTNIALNISGGTKAMSLAAHEVFLAYDKPIFYVHPESDHVMWLHPISQKGFDLEDQLRLPDFLSAMGTKIRQHGNRNKISESRRQGTNEIIKNISRYTKPLSALNWLAGESKRTLLSPELNNDQDQYNDILNLISLFDDMGHCKLEENSIRFTSDDSRFYCNGGWLEEHVYGVVHKLMEKYPIQDIQQGLEIERTGNRGTPVVNELDVAFLSNNKFFLVECKTRKFPRFPDEDGPGAESIYKLDSLVDLLAGTQGKGMLVSYLPLSKWDHQRAADLGIATCVGHQIQELPNIIKRWIEGNLA